jgi:hypothetical protein
MVPSSALTTFTDGERLMCDGFSLDETVYFGSFEFIVDCFGGLSLSPRRNNSGATIMGSTHSRSPSPRWAMIEDSTEEFHMVSSGEGAPASFLSHGTERGLFLPLSQPRHGWRILWPLKPLHRFCRGRRRRGRTHFSGGATNASPCSATQRQARGSATTSQAH